MSTSESPFPEQPSISECVQGDPIIRDMNELIVNCPELRELEKILGTFNIFRVLGATYHELRHSNMLAWLLQPEESHGLRDLFLRRWLMRVLNDADEIAGYVPDPAEIDIAQFVKVQVLREWASIDLLMLLDTLDGTHWIVAIENKVRATQGKEQLAAYRRRIEDAFPDKEYKLFLFLTKNPEKPKDRAYISADYRQVLEVLVECIEERRENIGREPSVLLKHYQEILEEAFMDESRVAELARRVYRAHKQAIDTIIEHKPDTIFDLTETLKRKIEQSAPALNIVPMKVSKGIVRFIPIEWNTEANRQGRAWGKEGSCYILCELQLWAGVVSLKIVESGAPKEWEDRLWNRSRTKPFTVHKNQGRPKHWLGVFSKPCLTVDLLDEDQLDIEQAADKILESLKRHMESREFIEARDIITEYLQELEQELKSM